MKFFWCVNTNVFQQLSNNSNSLTCWWLPHWYNSASKVETGGNNWEDNKIALWEQTLCLWNLARAVGYLLISTKTLPWTTAVPEPCKELRTRCLIPCSLRQHDGCLHRKQDWIIDMKKTDVVTTPHFWRWEEPKWGIWFPWTNWLKHPTFFLSDLKPKVCSIAQHWQLKQSAGQSEISVHKTCAFQEIMKLEQQQHCQAYPPPKWEFSWKMAEFTHARKWTNTWRLDSRSKQQIWGRLKKKLKVLTVSVLHQILGGLKG